MTECGGLFAGEIAGLRREGRYRAFADPERRAGAFPRARYHGPPPGERGDEGCGPEVTVCASTTTSA